MKTKSNRNDELIRKAMRLLGQRTSPAKAKASAANGRLGGRPKKTAEQIRAEIAALEKQHGKRATLRIARLKDELADREWKPRGAL